MDSPLLPELRPSLPERGDYLQGARMTGQSRSLGAILHDRLEITQEIAAANVEHLRLSQIASGMMVIDMKDEEHGTPVPAARQSERQENDAALERCMDEINRLEAKLARLDEELDAATKEEN